MTIQRAMKKVRLAETYNQFAGRALKYGLITRDDADLNAYIARKALDGLYLTIAEEERGDSVQPDGAAAVAAAHGVRHLPRGVPLACTARCIWVSCASTA